MAFNLARMFQQAFVRRIVYVAVALLLAVLGIGTSRAQTSDPCYSNDTSAQCPTKAEAYSNAKRVALAFNTGPSPPYPECVLTGPIDYPNTQYTCYYKYGSQQLSALSIRTWVTDACPDGRTWDAASNTCSCPAGEVEGQGGTCKTCSSLNSEAGSPALSGSITRSFGEKCIGGCKLKMDVGSGYCVTVIGMGGSSTCQGHYEYTGDSCTVDTNDPVENQPPPTTEPENTCTPAPDGQTFCLQRNGDHCYTFSSGQQKCWTPGETGEKGDGPILQVRAPGTNTPSPLNPTTIKGDPYSPQGSPTTTSSSNSTTTITTTVQNFHTSSGTNADHQGPSSGPGGSGSDAGGTNNGTGATGGGDCQSAPIVTGDAALGMVATQAWSTRCAVEAGNAASVTGDVGDCASAFSVSGTNANAIKLRAMRAEICGDNQPGWTKGAKPDVPGAGDTEDGTGHTRFGLGISTNMLDQSDMIGGGSCPNFSITIYGKTMSTSEFPYWCNALSILRALILIFAAYTAVRILTGSRD